jgi:hypothetical protein
LGVAAVLAASACGAVPPRRTEDPPPKPESASEAEAATGSGTPLLGGHLTVELPKGAVQRPRRESIMAAPSADTDETRIFLEEGGVDGRARFVLMVTELFLRGSGDLERDGRALAFQGDRVSRLAGARIPMVALEPGAATVDPDRPILVLAAIVGHPDGTLQQLEFLILPDMAAELETYARRARAIAETVAPGPRTLEARGGKVPLGETLTVELPAGYLVTKQEGPDFDLFRLRRLVTATEPTMMLGVYRGGHPSFQLNQASRDGGPAPSATEAEGPLFGQPARWITWQSRAGARFREAIVKRGELDAVHVYAIGADEAALVELQRIAATLTEAR